MQKKNLSYAIYLATIAHKDQYDKSGNPYILHCLHVMDAVKSYGEDYMIVAILHDIIEDTSYTIIDIVDNINLSQEMFDAIELLTHDKNFDTYEKYISKIAFSNNKIAIKVKMEDLRHNSDINRLKGLGTKDIKRIEKYHKAYTLLSSIWDKIYV